MRFLEIPLDVVLEALRELGVFDDGVPFAIVLAKRRDER
jgi:hypothetical protein